MKTKPRNQYRLVNVTIGIGFDWTLFSPKEFDRKTCTIHSVARVDPKSYSRQITRAYSKRLENIIVFILDVRIDADKSTQAVWVECLGEHGLFWICFNKRSVDSHFKAL